MSQLFIDNITVEFPGRKGDFIAVESVTLDLQAGEILGVVGESGAGKSTVGNAVIGLLQKPGRMIQGQILLDGERIDDLDDNLMRALRANGTAC